MSKRFPIPAFDRDHYKNMEWNPPKVLSESERARILAAAKAGDRSVVGSYVVDADDAFYERFRIRGPGRHVVMCVLPPGPVRLVGRSWAWYTQRALIVDSLDAAVAQVLHDWTTPRPMNTRLGPENGVEVENRVVYAVFGHRYADHWIPNRTMQDPRAGADAKGYAVISATDTSNNDFHACNLAFSWS